jgi:hypothetical protein
MTTVYCVIQSGVVVSAHMTLSEAQVEKTNRVRGACINTMLAAVGIVPSFCTCPYDNEYKVTLRAGHGITEEQVSAAIAADNTFSIETRLVQ